MNIVLYTAFVIRYLELLKCPNGKGQYIDEIIEGHQGGVLM
jgi:hypothetical protein